MPIYEFLCRVCGRSFEDLVRYEAIGEVRCPHCGSAELTRKVSRFASRQADRAGGGGERCGGG
ncbi:MAG TPA: zinc ribbon domain-containing protein [bacterium]|nr:zinc ribbon domain-containing protein [bacterium]